jgi:hypothetical protein
MEPKIKYIKLYRASTDSNLTVKLPVAMTTASANVYRDKYFPNWEWIHGSFTNPDQKGM